MSLPGTSDDPLELGDLNPELIQARIDARDTGKKGKEPTQLERDKEARLAQKEARLNTGAAPGAKGKQPPPSAPPTTPLPPQVNKSLLLDKIAAYRERFPHLKKRNNNVTAKSTADEILDELHYCELQLGSANGGPNIGATVVTVHAANSNPEMARAVKSMNQAVNVPKNAKDL